MEKTVLSVPNMWADHHVLRVRAVLSALDGVASVYASSAWKQVIVEHDPAQLDDAALTQALANAGYAVGELMELEGGRLSAGDPQWDELGIRVTKTNRRDLELSGDFRRY
jgi:copper chaperone CopZ